MIRPEERRSLTLNNLVLRYTQGWQQDRWDEYRPATVADLVEILPTIGAYEFKVEEDDIWGEPGTYLVLKVDE